MKTNKPVMAEMLVRHVFGETETFERTCAQRGLSVDEAVREALKSWIGQGLSLVEAPHMPYLESELELTPDPGDCPTGQEEHFIRVCEHDLQVLRQRQQACYRAKDRSGVERTTRKIERYIQTVAAIRDRVA